MPELGHNLAWMRGSSPRMTERASRPTICYEHRRRANSYQHVMPGLDLIKSAHDAWGGPGLCVCHNLLVNSVRLNVFALACGWMLAVGGPHILNFCLILDLPACQLASAGNSPGLLCFEALSKGFSPCRTMACVISGRSCLAAAGQNHVLQRFRFELLLRPPQAATTRKRLPLWFLPPTRPKEMMPSPSIRP
jgi:hypothetical protein